MGWRGAVAFAAIVTAMCISGGAQSAVTMTMQAPPPIGQIGGMPGVKGQPYSFVEKTTRIQTLEDGRIIATYGEERQMRDSEGRMRTEFASMNKAGKFEVLTVVLVDPVSSTDTTMFPRSKRAEVRHHAQPKPLTPEQQARMAENRARAASLPSPFENLPPATIAGFYAIGRRFTDIIPAGQAGNDREIRVVEDAWASPELNINMRTATDDPRVGRVTSQVTDFERNEPDPTLFRIPADYKVTERGQ